MLFNAGRGEGELNWFLVGGNCCRWVHTFQNLIWSAMTLLFTTTSFFACVHGSYDSIWCYLNWTLVLFGQRRSRFFQNLNLTKLSNLKKYLNLGVWNLKISFELLRPKHLSHDICPEPSSNFHKIYLTLSTIMSWIQ